MNTMQRSRLSTPRDYLALLVRRKWLILLTFLGSLGVALVVVSVIPNIYVSESLILFRPGEVSTDLVKEITNGTTDERVTAIQETILSRSNLLGIIKEYEHGLRGYQGLSEQKKADRMRSQLQLEFLSEKVRNIAEPVTHVRIRYRDENPELARKITERLSALFIEQENRTRETQVHSTAKFLEGELTKVLSRLSESRERVKALKERYREELPSQLEANLRALDRLQEQKTANEEALDRQTTLKLTIEQQLSQTPKKIRSEAAGGARTLSPLVETYMKKDQEYKDFVARATDKHPDVIRLKSELELLRQSIPPEDLDMISGPGALARADDGMEINPLYQSLMAQLSQVNTEIEIRQRERRYIERQISQGAQRVMNTPRAEQEIAATERQNEALLKQAEDLRTKLDQANLSQIVESRQQNAQFVVVDPADLPMEPAAPNRGALRLSGIGASLALALVTGILTDLAKRRVFTSFELERVLKAPVLVEIPRISSSRHLPQMRRMRLRLAAAFLAGVCVYGWGLYQLHANKSIVLRVLDPIIAPMNAEPANAKK